MSDQLNVDPKKFYEPATKGDVAKLVLYVQNTLTMMLTGIEAAKSSDQKTLERFLKRQEEVYNELKGFLDELIGQTHG